MADTFEHNRLNGPIPGESLTATPGNAPWEHPPKHTDLNEALQEMWDRLMQPKTTAKLMALLEAGIPAQAVADTLLFAGFTQGHWTPDLMILMAKPVWAMVAAIGHRAGINFKLKNKTEDDLDQFLRQMRGITKQPDITGETMPQLGESMLPKAAAKSAASVAPSSGFMGKRK